MRGEKIHSKINSIQTFRIRFAATHLGAVTVVDVSDASSNATPMQIEAGLMELKLVPSSNEIFLLGIRTRVGDDGEGRLSSKQFQKLALKIFSLSFRWIENYACGTQTHTLRTEISPSPQLK